jgi:hypothetical protein
MESVIVLDALMKSECSMVINCSYCINVSSFQNALGLLKTSNNKAAHNSSTCTATYCDHEQD